MNERRTRTWNLFDHRQSQRHESETIQLSVHIGCNGTLLRSHIQGRDTTARNDRENRMLLIRGPHDFQIALTALVHEKLRTCELQRDELRAIQIARDAQNTIIFNDLGGKALHWHASGAEVILVRTMQRTMQGSRRRNFSLTSRFLIVEFDCPTQLQAESGSEMRGARGERLSAKCSHCWRCVYRAVQSTPNARR